MPKGVCMPHRAFVNLLMWPEADTDIDWSGRTMQFGPCPLPTISDILKVR
jgi:hypothetical protein